MMGNESKELIKNLLDEVRTLKAADTSRELFATIQNYPDWNALRTIGLDSTTITTLLADYASYKSFKGFRCVSGKLFEIKEYYDVNFKTTVQVVFTKNTIGFYA